MKTLRENVFQAFGLILAVFLCSFAANALQVKRSAFDVTNYQTDVLHLARSFDTGLVATFKTLEDLDAYTVHPIHQEVAGLGKEIAAHDVSVDFF